MPDNSNVLEQFQCPVCGRRLSHCQAVERVEFYPDGKLRAIHFSQDRRHAIRQQLLGAPENSRYLEG